jgi:acetyl esterase/lipase
VRDCPHRQSATGVSAGSSHARPSTSTSLTGPVTLYGPLSRTLISTGGSLTSPTVAGVSGYGLAVETHAYGEAPEQAGDLWLPDGARQALPVAVLWHGGGYVPEVDRSIMEGVAYDLAGLGFAVWNLEYRRLGSGGGWPATFEDAAAGLDGRVVGIGFSAGAALALWAAARRDGAVRLCRVVNQAGLSDLEAVARDDEVSANLRELLGDPADVPEVYARANPARLLPLGVPQLHVHGDSDENIPLKLPESFVTRAREAGDQAELVVIPGAGHFAHNDPHDEAWRVVRRWLVETLLDGAAAA